jgi:carbamoylphosphate synthase large subunit
MGTEDAPFLTAQRGILDKYNVELIGAKLPSIDKAEDRDLFKQARHPLLTSHTFLTLLKT